MKKKNTKKGLYDDVDLPTSPFHKIIESGTYNNKQGERMGYAIFNKKIFSKTEEKEKFKAEVLTCNELKFNTNTGDVTYGKINTTFKPDKNEFKLLRALLERKNERLDYDEINKALGKEGNSKKDRRDISDIIKNIKTKLGINKKIKNKNLFRANNGYIITCN